jgi:hypothetical protein
VGAARVGQRQALGDHRVDLALTEQLEQHAEVDPEPFRIAGPPQYGNFIATNVRPC